MYMFVQMRKMTIQEGFAEQVIERFSRKPSQGPSLMEKMPGYIGREILRKKVRRGEEEIIMMVRWESEEAWKNWEKSPEHIAGHKKKIAEGKGKPERPAYILDVEMAKYEVIE